MGVKKELLKQALGSLLMPWMRQRTERVAQHDFSMTVGPRSLIDSCLRAALARKLLRDNQVDVMSYYHQQFWTGDSGTEFHRSVREQVLEVYESDFQYLVDEINQLIVEFPELETVAEIGVGGGSFIHMLSENIKGIDNWIGNDLSMDIIAENKDLYPGIEWFAGDGKAWVETYGEPNTIFLTFRGVLEYFTQENLDAMFASIAQQLQPAVFVLVEPVALDHRLATQRMSRAYGTEYSFSHNYPHLLKKNGFIVRHQKLVTYDDHHLCAMIATAGLGQAVEEPTQNIIVLPRRERAKYKAGGATEGV